MSPCTVIRHRALAQVHPRGRERLGRLGQVDRPACRGLQHVDVFGFVRRTAGGDEGRGLRPAVPGGSSQFRLGNTLQIVGRTGAISLPNSCMTLSGWLSAPHVLPSAKGDIAQVMPPGAPVPTLSNRKRYMLFRA